MDPKYVARKAALEADIKHNKGIIAQSNNRASGIAQLLAAIVTLIGVMGAVSDAETKMTPAPFLLGWIAAVGLLVSVAGLLSVVWPRLRGMAKDDDLFAYQSRMYDVADAPESTESLDYPQAFRMQKIAFIKERSTQVAVAGMLVMCGAAMAMFAILL